VIYNLKYIYKKQQHYRLYSIYFFLTTDLDALEKRSEAMVEGDNLEMKKSPDAMKNDAAKLKEQEEAELEKFSFAAEIINDKLNILKEDYMKMDIRLDELIRQSEVLP